MTVSIRCPYGPTGANATRICGSDGKWNTDDITTCANPKITSAFNVLAQVSRCDNCMCVSIYSFISLDQYNF